MSSDIGQRNGWLPGQDDLEEWLAGHRERAERRGSSDLHRSVQALKGLLDREPVLRMYATQMIEQIPDSKPYTQRHLSSVDQMLTLIDEVLECAPRFDTDSTVMVPLNAILDWTMGTTPGMAFYRDPRVNAAFKDILDEWCQFLSSPASLYVLNDGPNGWMSSEAQNTIGIDQFVHDETKPHWGFSSWNDFFTRRFLPDVRPVAAPDDARVIASACESTPYALQSNVRRKDSFWVKRHPYSLDDLLAGDPVVDELVGGTVYQAFLSATEYHRWHAPVAGVVERAFVQPGTYFSEADVEGESLSAPQGSQGYLAHVATRAIIIIRADNPMIGPVVVVPVGMGDVSSCVIGDDIRPGTHVAKGDELGYFQFGGSTECVLFAPGAIDSFALHAIPHPHAHPVKVRSHLATAAAPS